MGAKGEVEEILGGHLDPGLEIDVAIRAHDIPHEWPDEVLSEAGALRDEPSEADKQTGLISDSWPLSQSMARTLVTSTTPCTVRKKRVSVWGAIADVNHYVPIGSALDEEANTRGNSVYFQSVLCRWPEFYRMGFAH